MHWLILFVISSHVLSRRCMGQVTYEWQSGRRSVTPFSQVLKGKKASLFFLGNSSELH